VPSPMGTIMHHIHDSRHVSESNGAGIGWRGHRLGVSRMLASRHAAPTYHRVVALPRILVIMGSGETAPTMVRSHRMVMERLGAAREGAEAAQAPGVLLETPFGFQTNAGEIAERTVAYFANSVGTTIVPAGLRRREDLAGPRGDAIVAALAAAPFVFSGPGSPSFALRQWKGTLVPSILAEKISMGGALVFSSAAALTLGRLTVPVYEIYKVGDDPRWLDGLDLLSAVGLEVAVIPHYDNAEGGTHDTRYCYLGEERLAALEDQMPEEAFVLGVDEHTALHIDLSEGVVLVSGRGAVTLRRKGRSMRIPAGSDLELADLLQAAGELLRGQASGESEASGGKQPAPPATADRAGSVAGSVVSSAASPATADREVASERASTDAPMDSMDNGVSTAEGAPADAEGRPSSQEGRGGQQASNLLEAVRLREMAFREAAERLDPSGMLQAMLGLHDDLLAWSADTLQSDHFERASASLRAMAKDVVRLAEVGSMDPAILLKPFLDLIIEVRAEARRAGRFAEADKLRDALVARGVRVHDRPQGTIWELGERPNPLRREAGASPTANLQEP